MKTSSLSSRDRHSLARVFALTVLAIATIIGAWLAGETVSRAFAAGGNPAWLNWPFAVGAPAALIAAVWTMWFAEFFKHPAGLRWTRWAKVSLALGFTMTVVAACSTVPFFKAVL